MSKIQYKSEIDGLRAVAFLLVVGFHFFPGIIQGRVVGVDIFFIIAGYLITVIIYRLLIEDGFNLHNFYIKRI